jgi:hypothetical protein
MAKLKLDRTAIVEVSANREWSVPQSVQLNRTQIISGNPLGHDPPNSKESKHKMKLSTELRREE